MSKETKKTLLIDVGSTNVKIGLYDITTKSVETTTYPFPKPLVDKDGIFEVSIDAIWELIDDIISKYLLEVEDLFLSVQMHGYILFDALNRPVTNYVSWQDQRGKSMLNLFDLSYEYGLKMKPNLPRLSIAYMEKHYNKIYQQASKVMSLGSFLSFKLTGRNITHITDAFSLGFLNVIFNEYVKTQLELPISTTDIICVGNYKGIKVYTPVGDHQASIYAINDLDGYILNLGTAGQMCTIDDDMDNGPFESRPFFDHKTIKTVTGILGGKYIYNNACKTTIVEELYEAYSNAILKLPKRNHLVVTGGATKHHKAIISQALDKIQIKYYFNDSSALDGLIKIKEKTMEIKLGTMLSEFNDSNIPIIFKKSGLDFFILDYEHGAFDHKDILSIITVSRLSHIKVFVRLSNNSRKDITKIMDMGPDGLILPMTSTKEDIQKVVNYAMYFPLGNRGLSTMRAHSFYNSPSDLCTYMKQTNEKVKIFAQIETIEGVRNYQEIVRVDGVSGIFIGPNDLSASYGGPGNVLNDKILKAIQQLFNNKHKEIGIITSNEKLIELAKANNCDYLSIGSELSILKKAYETVVKQHK